MSRKNRASPLLEARELGSTLAYNGVDGEAAQNIIDDYSSFLYHKPRAERYRKLWADSAMRGYESTRKYG